ncbi:MAG TPA: DUF3090 family protein [Candidatus Limnocylindrales bacterium]|nr:DUF3090 family protein [Candidatus Limnocylindrales bacterium]
MTRRIFSFDAPDRFVVGAIGQPGQRTFYLQAAKGAQVVSVALEKAQVAVLAERLASLLLALRQGGVAIEEDVTSATALLDQPVVEQFRVGTLTLGWDGERQRIVIEAREITDEDEDEEEDDDEGEAEEPEEALALGANDLEDGPDLVRVQLDATAALAFASGAVAVIQAGRPPCPQCGAPLDPIGHFCPRRNGYQN